MSHTRAEDREMMLTPLRWPRWPWLPVKQPQADGSWPNIGSIYADDTEEGKPVTVRFDPKLNPNEPKTYPDVDALLDDGWVVD